MNVKQLAQEFQEQGFLVLENFFAPEPMDEIDQIIRQYFGDNPDFRHEDEFLEKSQTEVIPWFPQNSDLPEYSASLAEPFDRLESDTRLKELTVALLGEEWERLYGMVMWSRGGTVGQAWHQDCPPDNPAKFNLNRLVYTRDISAEVGGQTVVMPGSHRKGLLPAGDPHEDLEGQLVLPYMRRNDVIIIFKMKQLLYI